MPVFSEIAYAKINLALHVRRQRENGYHDIETIFAFVDDGDRIEVSQSDVLSLRITGPFAESLSDGADNLVLQTAALIQRKFSVAQGATLTLDKRLPIASGIGGGSADAAATARLLNRHWQIGASERELANLLAPLGADIPACVSSQIALGTGTGTELSAIDNGLSGTAALLVNPRKTVSTAAIFRAWDGIDRGGLMQDDVLETILAGRNDLEPMATALCPEIADILDILMSQSPVLARMSGSGATCFALFDNIDHRDEVAAAIAEANISWWTMAGTLR